MANKDRRKTNKSTQSKGVGKAMTSGSARARKAAKTYSKVIGMFGGSSVAGSVTVDPQRRPRSKDSAVRASKSKSITSQRLSLRTPDTRVRYETLMGLPVSDPVHLRDQVEKGLPYAALQRLQENLGIDDNLVAHLIRVALRTLYRRKAEGRLQPEESDRAVRASRLLSQTLALFNGDMRAARQWLMTPQLALGGENPLEFARTELGAREVEKLIGRLEHGVFS